MIFEDNTEYMVRNIAGGKDLVRGFQVGEFAVRCAPPRYVIRASNGTRHDCTGHYLIDCTSLEINCAWAESFDVALLYADTISTWVGEVTERTEAKVIKMEVLRAIVQRALFPWLSDLRELERAGRPLVNYRAWQQGQSGEAA